MPIPEDISKTEKIDPTKQIEPGEEGAEEPGKEFSSYMKGTPPSSEATPTSPMDLASQGVSPSSPPTLESVHGQLNSMSTTVGELQKNLHTLDEYQKNPATKTLKLKRSQQYLLRNKLTDSNQHLRSAAEKLGADVGPPPKSTTRQNPITRYINMVSDSQKQMDSAQAQVKKLSAEGQAVQPAQLLQVQVKINKATQEMEYASVLLSNAVSAFKQLTQVQI